MTQERPDRRDEPGRDEPAGDEPAHAEPGRDLPDVPQIGRGGVGVRLDWGVVAKILLTVGALVAVIVLRQACADGVAGFVTGFTPPPDAAPARFRPVPRPPPEGIVVPELPGVAPPGAFGSGGVDGVDAGAR